MSIGKTVIIVSTRQVPWPLDTVSETSKEPGLEYITDDGFWSDEVDGETPPIPLTSKSQVQVAELELVPPKKSIISSSLIVSALSTILQIRLFPPQGE